MKAFREAIETGAFDTIGDLLADDVMFRSPVGFRPYEGRPLVHSILRGVSRVFEDFHYVDEIDGGGTSALVFETRIGDASVHGCDFIRVNGDGLISELTVMVRPLSAAQALAEAMSAQFDRIQSEALAAMEA